MFYDPVRLRTLARFSAPDPWSEDLFTDYSLDEYVMLPLGSKRNLDSKWSLHTFGIRWERDSRYRLLPESLVELWKCQRISPEKLPWLLHALEPRLLETDCITSQSWQRSVGIPLLMLLLVCPLVFLLIRVDGQAMPAGAAVGSGLAIAMLTGAILWMMKSSKRSRVKQQMTWAINRMSGDSSSGPAAEIAAPTTLFFRLSLKLFVVFIALAALALGAGFAFFKFSG